MTRIAELQDRLLRLARRREDDGIYTDAELVRAAERALAQAYDREDAAQRGEPDPWNLDDPGDIGDSDTWVSERLACARAAAEAFLSALEPAAPEGQQDNEPRAYIIHAPEDNYYGTGPDRLQFHPLAQRDLDNGYRQTPLYVRPVKQVVTEAMVDAVVKVVQPYTRKYLFMDELQVIVRTAINSVMEKSDEQ